VLNMAADNITRASWKGRSILNEAACLVRSYVANSTGEVHVNFRLVVIAQCFHVDEYP